MRGQLLDRTDLAPGLIEIVDAQEAPTLKRSPAVRTPEGYLLVDALIARDGLLKYSDGDESWMEYRSRETLVAAADSWESTPITDGHPTSMITSQTWAALAKGGHVAGSLKVLEPDEHGVSYLAARLLIQDATQIQRIDNGKVQLSIGFRSLIVPTVDGLTPDGTVADAEQTQMEGNHNAFVMRGRAGPAVQVLLDGADVQGYNGPEHMRTQKATAHVPKTDEIGAPVDQVQITGPDGEEITVPTWLAAEHTELKALKAAQTPAPPAAPAPPAPMPGMPPAPMPGMPPAPMPEQDAVHPEPAPGSPAPGAAPPFPGAQAPTEDAAGGAPFAGAAPPFDDDKEKPMTSDDINAIVSKRVRLARLASEAGVPAEVCDGADQAAIARGFLKIRQPWLAEKLDSMDGDALDFAVESAAAMPAPKPSKNPLPIRDRSDAASDETPTPAAVFMASQGYR